MTKNIFILLLLNSLLLTGIFAQDKTTTETSIKDIKIITNRLVADYLKNTDESPQTASLLSSLKPDGSWPNIDYTGVNADFPAGSHLKKLRALAVAYAKPGTTFYLNEKLEHQIRLGLDYYLSKKPTSLNWWFNEIGAPQDYMVILILLKDHVANEDLKRYATYLKDLTDNPSHRGMNRIWVSAITVNKGCIENDHLLVSKGFQSIASTLIIANEQGIEGIKIDNSFHQHRPQLYSGGYGMGFAESTATLMALSANTSFNRVFSAEKKKLFSDLLLYGHQLFSYRQAVDFGSIGRNIARANAINSINSTTLDKLAIIYPDNASVFQDWKLHLKGADFPKAFRGNKYFWKSDIMTQHGKDYYLSAKVISTRTNGTEMLNGENLKGYNLPLGATNLLRTGEEYKDIFPVWDWTRVPGTTAVMNQSAAVLPWYLFGTNEFAGGVSNGEVGAIAYAHSYNGVQAKKAYFFVDGEMLCLGAGVNAIRTQQVVTSVNQCFSQGDILFGTKTAPQGALLTDSLKKANNLQWVYHNGFGYLFPAGGDISLKNARQTGSWKSINSSASGEAISAPIFSLWLNHGIAPKDDSYCYVVMPESSLERFKQRALKPGFEVLKNDKHIQGVKYQDKYFLVFYEAGKMDLGNGFTIEVDGKAIVMLAQKERGFQVSAADPTHQQTNVNIVINQKLKGTTKINITYPKGDDTGSTISKFYETN